MAITNRCGHAYEAPFFALIRHRTANDLCHSCTTAAGKSNERRGIDGLRWLWRVLLFIAFVAVFLPFSLLGQTKLPREIWEIL
jgi:hypothetical protein